MFASYPDLAEKTPSSWFAWTGDKVISHTKEICHAKLCYDGTGWDNLITAVPKNDELSLEYLRMLIRGPFCSMSDLIKLDRVGKNYFLHLLCLNKWPANVLMNFCIASRVPIEFEFLLSPWAARCDKGFEPTLAFLLTYSYGSKWGEPVQHDYRSFDMARVGHMWIDPGSNWTNILFGTFQDVSKPFTTHPQDARPTNLIWGHCDDYWKLQKMTDDEIAAFYTQPIQVLEPPPPPQPVFKKAKKFVFQPYGEPQPAPMNPEQAYIQAMQALAQHDMQIAQLNNPAAEIALGQIEHYAPNWILPNAPQPAVMEHYIEDADEDPPQEWFAPDDDD